VSGFVFFQAVSILNQVIRVAGPIDPVFTSGTMIPGSLLPCFISYIIYHVARSKYDTRAPRIIWTCSVSPESREVFPPRVSRFPMFERTNARGCQARDVSPPCPIITYVSRVLYACRWAGLCPLFALFLDPVSLINEDLCPAWVIVGSFRPVTRLSISFT